MSFTLAWTEMLEREVGRIVGRRPSLNDLASIHPVDLDLKMENSPREKPDYSASKTKWSRLRNGKTAIIENSMTSRIERRYPHLTAIRKNSLWPILENPLMPPRQIKSFIRQLEPTLGNKLFYFSNSKPHIRYKSLYWSDQHCELIESIDSFALKLALYRLNKLGELRDKWPISEKCLVLNLYRMCMRSPWRIITDQLTRLLHIFLDANKSDSFSNTDLEFCLHSAPTDFLYQELFQWVTPEESDFFTRYPTLNHYLKAQRTMIQNFWNGCIPQFEGYPPIDSFSLQALYWADCSSETWLLGKRPKETLFNRDSELFDLHRTRIMRFGCRKKIW